MSDQSMRLNLIMGMVDKITAPVKNVTNQTSRMSEKVKKSQQELTKLGRMNKDVEHFKQLSKKVSETKKEFTSAQQKANDLAQQLKATSNPSKQLTKEFEQATKAANNLKKQHIEQQTQLATSEKKLRQTGVATGKLERETRRIAAETNKYTRLLKQQESALAKVAKQQQKTAELTQRNKDMRMSAGVDTAKVSAGIYAVKKLVDAYGDVASAQGEIQSLGIDDDGIKSITATARRYSNQWAGTTQSEFIRASYDIKSGISSLSDTAVGEMTKIAALTAGATKSSTSGMTSLFATGYGIYRKQFEQFGSQTIAGWNQLSDAERDMKFGEYFSAGISSSVQAFKTDGSKMSQAISGLGAQATSANVSFAEQLSILGMLSATMEGGQAATKYSAFLANAGKAADKLGLQFHDSNNQLLSLPKILQELRNHYGETLDDIEKQELTTAFGTKEAIAMIDQLYPKVDELESSISGMSTSLSGGMEKTNQMASAILKGPAESLQLMNQRVTNAAAGVGKVFAPTMVFAATVVGDLATGLADMMERFPMLSNFISIAVTLLVAFKLASIAARFSYSTLSDALIFGRKVMTALTLSNIKHNAVMAVTKARAMASTAATLALAGAQKVLAVAQWAVNAAMLANPIGLVIAGVAALIAIVALIVKHWEPITEFFGSLWKKIQSIFAGALDFITNVLLSPINALKESLGGVWDSLFGDDEKSVNINKRVKEMTERVPSTVNSATDEDVAAIGAIQVATVGGNVAASASVPGTPSVTNDYGGIVIQGTEGMNEKMLAREVRRQLDERDQLAAQRQRGRLYD